MRSLQDPPLHRSRHQDAESEEVRLPDAVKRTRDDPGRQSAPPEWVHDSQVCPRSNRAGLLFEMETHCAGDARGGPLEAATRPLGASGPACRRRQRYAVAGSFVCCRPGHGSYVQRRQHPVLLPRDTAPAVPVLGPAFYRGHRICRLCSTTSTAPIQVVVDAAARSMFSTSGHGKLPAPVHASSSVAWLWPILLPESASAW